MLQCPLGLQYTTESKDAVLEFHKAVVALAEYSSNVSTFLDKALECDRNFIMPHVLRVKIKETARLHTHFIYTLFL